MRASKPSNDSGTWAPAARSAAFLAAADVCSEPDLAPACPNCTSVLNIVAQVPETQATTGLVTRPDRSISATSCSAVPPSSPRRTMSLISGMRSYRAMWSANVEPAYASPPMAMPSKSPSVTRERIE
eukprot:Amastigsp_a841279_504.p6 type:complete len:127 gc:universal Amastigsp_a841279_504:990-610(-)